MPKPLLEDKYYTKKFRKDKKLKLVGLVEKLSTHRDFSVEEWQNIINSTENCSLFNIVTKLRNKEGWELSYQVNVARGQFQEEIIEIRKDGERTNDYVQFVRPYLGRTAIVYDKIKELTRRMVGQNA